MTMTTILAAGTNAAPSTDVVVNALESLSVSIFSPTEKAGIGQPFEVVQVTPGATNHVCYLDNATRQTTINGPITIRVLRPDLGVGAVAFGVFTEV